MSETKNIGLRGITVADSKISKVDGDAGDLYYRGYSILELAKSSNFEETAHLLLYGVDGVLPSDSQLKEFSTILASERNIPAAVTHSLSERPHEASVMNVIQAAVPMLADNDRDMSDESRDANVVRALQLIAKMPTIVAYWHRIKTHQHIIEPRSDLSHAANFLHMLHGEIPDEQMAHDFDICLILHADHTFNASTFSAREVASTRADMYAAVSAAIGALSGELHGGAATRVMQMLEAIGDPANVAEYVANQLKSGGKIFGIGHAVYKTWDPRAKVLAPMSERLGKLNGETKWYDISAKVVEEGQKQFKEMKGVEIYPNVDFFSASVYRSMGIDPEFNTAMFALSRIVGWCAHIIEERFAEAQPKPALYRPRAEYIGNYCGPEGCSYTPMDKR